MSEGSLLHLRYDVILSEVVPSRMTAERWQLVKSIFFEALDLEKPFHAEFVAARCGDDIGLKQEVESLLAADAVSGSNKNMQRLY